MGANFKNCHGGDELDLWGHELGWVHSCDRFGLHWRHARINRVSRFLSHVRYGWPSLEVGAITNGPHG